MSAPSRRAVLAGAATGSLVAGSAAAFDLNSLLGSPEAKQIIGGITGLAQSFTMTEADEVRMGESYYPKYLQQSGGAVNDRATQDAMRAFAQPFAATSQRDFPWEITVVESKEVNAWALPGGKMAVNSALIAHSDDPAELASVVAHEIGHAELSHGVQSMKTASFMNLLSGSAKLALTAAIGGDVGNIGNSVLTALEGPVYQLVNSGYSRDREFEADNHILKVFEQTGQDPEKADDFFATLQQIYPSNTSATTSLFSTHPGTADRIARLQDNANRFPRTGRTETPAGWAVLKERYPTPAAFRRG